MPALQNLWTVLILLTAGLLPTTPKKHHSTPGALTVLSAQLLPFLLRCAAAAWSTPHVYLRAIMLGWACAKVSSLFL
jgi:hypothetical protein